MQLQLKHPIYSLPRAFTLVELMVVIVIVSILMTAGAIGLNGMGGKSVTSAVATSEALFNEARLTAKSRNLRSCVLVAKALDSNTADDLRRIIVAYEKVDPLTGEPLAAADEDPDWDLSSRGTVLPDRVYFSELLSREDHEDVGSDGIQTVTLSDVKPNYQGDYFIYQFNGEGVCTTPGASFVIGSGARNSAVSSITAPPVVTAKAERDFGGFVVWRNGGTSLFRSPDQVSETLPEVNDNF